jgi:hypothetical protein
MPEAVAPLRLVSLTTTQRNALTPAEPMVVFDSTLSAVFTYIDGQWVALAPTSRQTIANPVGGYTVGTTDARIYGTYAFNTTLTADRLITLCAANVVPAGFRMRIEDAGSGCATPTSAGTTFEIQVKAKTGDTMENVAPATNFEVIREARGSIEVESDGVSNWSIVAVVPHTRVEVWTVAATHTSKYRKPLTCRAVRVVAIGGGGGGAAGHQQNAATNAGGGGGGGPGGFSDITLIASDVGVTETVVVGAKGTGGTTRTTAGNGQAGIAGNASTFTAGGGVVVYAGGGAGGGAALSSGGPGGVPGVGTGFSDASLQFTSFVLGNGTGAAPAGTVGAVAAWIGLNGGPGGGGGGGGVTAANGQLASTDGGVGAYGYGVAGVGAAGGPRGTSGNVGSAGTAATAVGAATILGGGGGGGGGSRAATAGAGFAGGAGGKYGGGGGGGGPGIGAGNANGAGGDGADGAVQVISYR